MATKSKDKNKKIGKKTASKTTSTESNLGLQTVEDVMRYAYRNREARALVPNPTLVRGKSAK